MCEGCQQPLAANPTPKRLNPEAGNHDPGRKFEGSVEDIGGAGSSLHHL